VAWTFKDVPEAAKWVGSLAMLIGRVEIFALILLLTPAFWER
jgi:trk system potassium uptake protein TrkH